MSKTTKLLKSLSVITAAASIVAVTSGTANAGKNKLEKCYGVVKAGKNDCASSDGKHSCAGAAEKDALGTEWVLVPEGLCDKLANGSKEPKK